MRQLSSVLFASTSGLLMSVCALDVSAQASDAAESGCMQAVNSNYGGNVDELRVVSSEFSQANSEVILDADGTRWRCLVSEDGEVQDLSVQENSSGSSKHGSKHSSSSSSGSGSGFEMAGRTSGHCKLSNVDVGKELFNGRCSIKESTSKYGLLYEIQMGSAEPYLFATSDGRTWMHGPDEVRFEDRGHTGIFRWADFRLEVDDN